MSLLRFALSTLALLFACAVSSQAQERIFSHPAIAGDALRYETYLKGAFKNAANTSSEQRRAALAKVRQPAEARAAANQLAAVVVQNPNDAEDRKSVV